MPITRRLLPLAAAALAAWSLARPAPGQEPPARPDPAQEVPVRPVSCGAYEAVPSGFRASGQPTRLTLQKAGRLVSTVTDWAISAVRCEALDAGAGEMLIVRTFSGGAHCCETTRAYALGASPRLVLQYPANNAIGLDVTDLDGDGRKELVLGDDTFAYFDDLCYACSPSRLPLVACLAGGRFEDCTRRFPQLVRTELERRLAELRQAGADPDLARGRALGVVALSVLLGEEDKGLRAVGEAAPSEAVRAWLEKALPQVRDWAGARARKLKDGTGNR